MHPDLPRLRELQSVDNRIRELKLEIGRLPKYIADIERQLEIHKKKLEADREVLSENRKEHRRLEGDIAALEQKVSRLRDQMNEAKTNEQFRAFQHEIQFIEGQIRNAEDRILDKMVEAESLTENVNKAEKALEIEQKKVDEEVAATRSRVAKDEEELEAARAHRKELAGAVSAESFRLYERISRRREGFAVALANVDRCLACNVVFRPQFSQLLRRNDQVLTCESCTRILYYEPSDQGANEDVDSGARAASQ